VVLVDTGAVVKAIIAVAPRLAIRVLRAAVVVGTRRQIGEGSASWALADAIMEARDKKATQATPK
jgi:3-deoxy-D-manno-octulosonate 8-phosphate phosphatase KdsC-like HAD superfamily phosphatase